MFVFSPAKGLLPLIRNGKIRIVAGSKSTHNAPPKFHWHMSIILKIDNYFSALLRVCRRTELRDQAVLSPNSHVGALTDVRDLLSKSVGCFHRLPLQNCKYSHGQGC